MLEHCGRCPGGPGEAAQALCCATGQSERATAGGVGPCLGKWLVTGTSKVRLPLSAGEPGGGVGSALTPGSALQGRGRHRGGCRPHSVLLEALLGPYGLPAPLPAQVGGRHHNCLMADAHSEAPREEGPTGPSFQTTGEFPRQSQGDVAYNHRVISLSLSPSLA